MTKFIKPDRRDEIALPFAIRSEINVEKDLIDCKNSLTKFYFLGLFFLATVILFPRYSIIFHIDSNWLALPWLALLSVLFGGIPKARKGIKDAHTRIEKVKILVAQGKYKDACLEGGNMDIWGEYTQLLHAEGLKASDY